ncbi:MAG: aminotransferase class I/II-fold pyridoxal phosphate-dependent enzyme, partial [Candidatus Limnocylindrales bacterium]
MPRAVAVRRLPSPGTIGRDKEVDVHYRRMPIEAESPEQVGYGRIRCNLAESSVADATLGDLGEGLGGLVLQYGDHLGLPALREAIAADGAGLAADDVLVTPGAVAALFLVHTTLIQAGDHLVVTRPNYATNVETPRAIGADVEYLDLAHEDGWAVDPDRVAAMLRPETVLVSVTTPHNPTGSTLDRDRLDALIGIVERHGRARLLVDETYREMTFGEPLPVAASLSDRVISVTSLS